MMPIARERVWFGQPRGLTVLFLTNMWEQFSYYGMRALLVYYMTKQLLIGQETSSFIYGAYTSCAYFTPIIGGVIADRILGKRRAIIIGASTMATGHFMMAFDGLFYVALAVIALGNGLFLPSLPSQVGDLYRPDDPRRGWAYNVYYVGVNIGGFLAPLICGTVGELYGWHYGFGIAGVGMLAGLVIYLSGQCYLPAQETVTAAEPSVTIRRFDRRTVALLLAIGLAVTLFRSAYEQVGNTVALWADTGVDRSALGHAIPMTWFQSLNPLFVMIMTPPLLAYWRQRAGKGHDQPAARRMALGASIVGAAYLLLAGISWAQDGKLAGWAWLALFFLIFTFGEIFILPTGLGLFARLAPLDRGATTVAAWFLFTFTGSLSAGLVGTFWSGLSHPAFFILLTGLAGSSAILLLALSRATQQLEQI